jgi:hypothetical protein
LVRREPTFTIFLSLTGIDQLAPQRWEMLCMFSIPLPILETDWSFVNIAEDSGGCHASKD